MPFSFPPPSTADPQISSDMLQSFRRVLRRNRRKELFPCDVSTNCALKSDQFRIEGRGREEGARVPSLGSREGGTERKKGREMVIEMEPISESGHAAREN